MKYVESTYLARWRGIVLSEYDIRTSYPQKYRGIGYKVLIVYDQSGNRMRRKITVSRNKDWFKPCKPFDISWINKDWLI